MTDRAHWEITHASLAELETSEPWKKWAESGHSFTAAGIYGPGGKLGHWGHSWDTASQMRSALCCNMGGGVPIDVIEHLVEISAVS